MYHPFFKYLALFFYLVLVMCGLLIPSDGSHGLFSPKSLAFVACCFSLTGYFLLKRHLNVVQVRVIFATSALLFFLFFWTLVALCTGKTDLFLSIDQMKLFLITWAVVASSMLLYEEGLVPFSLFLKTAVYTNAFYSVLKILCVFLFLLEVITLDQLVKFTGIRVMSMAMFGDVSRFQTSMDISTPFLIYFVLNHDLFQVHLPSWFKKIYIPFSLLSVLISFSRVFIFIALVSLSLYFITRSFNRLCKGVGWAFLGMSVFVLVIGPDSVYQMVESRLLSSENKSSDDIRDHQVRALLSEASVYPLFGMGLGGYAEEAIRDEGIKHSYEVQWVAFLAQFGVVGLVFLVLPLFFLGVDLWLPPLSSARLSLFVLFLGWVLSGFTNPFVISLTSGLMYSLFVLASIDLRTCSESF